MRSEQNQLRLLFAPGAAGDAGVFPVSVFPVWVLCCLGLFFEERVDSASVFGGYWLLVLVFYPLEGISFSSRQVSCLDIGPVCV